ncbi:MAG: hypothetical protein QXE76_06585 [Candidatus Bathyarchaeia archaeon]
MGRDFQKIVCRNKEEAKQLLEAYKTITRIKKFPEYRGYTIENILYLEIID